MSNSIAPGSSADVNIRVTALTTNPNVPAQYKTIILKKNLVNGVNTLTQAMMNQTNTKYVIKYDYTLGDDITVPANCVLEFDGGSITASGNNDTITGANTGIEARLVKIFNTDVTLAGTWNVAEAYPEWFGAKGDGSNDDAPAINKALTYFNCVKLLPRTYLIGSIDSNGIGIKIPAYRTLKGYYHDENLSKVTSIIMMKEGLNYTSCIDIIGNNCILEDFSVKGYGVVNVETACISAIEGHSRCTLNRIDVSGGYYGFNLHLYLTTMTQCNANYCSIGFYIHGGDNTKYTTFVAICCYACDCRIRGHYWKKMTYSSMISCAADGCGCPNSGVVDNNTELGFAYYFDACDTISVIDCGCERCLRAIYCNMAQPVIFKGCNFYISKHQNSTFNSSFALTDIIIIKYSVEVEIDNCIIETSAVSSYYTETSELIQLYGTSQEYRMLIYKPSIMGFINLSNIKSQGSVSIYRNLDYNTTRYCRNSTEGARPTFENAFEKAYYLGFMYYDKTLHKPIWWNGTAWVDTTGATV